MLLSGKEGMPAVPTALIGGFSWTRDQLKRGFIREDTVAVSSNFIEDESVGYSSPDLCRSRMSLLRSLSTFVHHADKS